MYIPNKKIDEIISDSSFAVSHQWRLPPAFSTPPTAALPIYSSISSSLNLNHANTSLPHIDSPLSLFSPTITSPPNPSTPSLSTPPFSGRPISPSPPLTSTASFSARMTPHSTGISPPAQHSLIKGTRSALGMRILRWRW